MATKTTTKKTTSKKATEKKTDTTKKVVAKSTSAKATTKKATTSKKVDDSTTKVKKTTTKKTLESKSESKGVETSKKYDSSSSSSTMPVRHEKQFGQNKFYSRRKKFCKLCAKGIEHVDYKDIELLSKYLNHNMKISSRKQTSACASHQRRISNAIKRARIVALIHCVKD